MELRQLGSQQGLFMYELRQRPLDRLADSTLNPTCRSILLMAYLVTAATAQLAGPKHIKHDLTGSQVQLLSGM